MRVMHLHFGRDGGAERFFVHLARSLARHGVQQKTVLRPGRIWRPMIEPWTDIIESHFRTLSLSRLTLPPRVTRLANTWQPDAMMAWVPKGCKLMPPREGCVRVMRLGDYPRSLKRFDNADVIVANAPDIIKRVENLGWDGERHMISNFTSREYVAPVARSEFQTPDNAVLLVSSGRFVERKGFDVLIRAVEKLPDAYFWLIGDGDEAQALHDLVNQLGVADRVRFIGWQADIRKFIAAADVFVMPSRHEPLGNVVLEAWAQNKPVVSANAEGPRWFMKNGENGLVVDVDDVTALADAIQKVASDAALRRRLCAGGQAALSGPFDEEKIVAAYLRLFARHRPDAEALVAQHLDHAGLVADEVAH
ncbi:MAG: glycosyltransferase [Pseudomonadota bacterium]